MRPLLIKLLNVLIAIYLVILVVRLYTGGFDYEILGMHISSDRLGKILRVLLPLIFLRLIVALDRGNAVLVLVSLAISLLFAEYALRVLQPAIATADLQVVHQASPRFDWELIPGSRGTGGLGEHIEINSMGMRDVEYDVSKGNQIRIAAIGDSFTFGMGLDLQDGYLKQLEKRLRGQQPRVEVMNFGVIAYQLWQYLEVLEQRVYATEPDLVIVGFFLDDISVSAEPANRNPEGRNRFNIQADGAFTASHLFNVVRNLGKVVDIRARQRRSRMLRNLEDRREALGPTGIDGGPHPSYLVATGQIKESILQDFDQAMKHLAESTRDHGVDLLALYIPDSTQLYDPQRQGINKLFADAAAKYAIPLIDLTPYFEAADDVTALFLFPNDGHASKQGNALIVEALAEHELIQKTIAP
ncbi:MAG: SGNH/GDSL hydrolase family protein [Pseudomonadales bacterium]